jgi:peptide/nickel transport system permease protein
MIQFIIRRILYSVPVLLGIVFVTFTLARVLPGDPCRAVLGEKATDQVCDAFIRRNGLDKPIPTQFVIYLGQVLQGDLGNSFRQGRSSVEILAERLPVTIELAIAAMIFATIVGIPMGIISAYWRNTPLDVVTMIGANIGVSTPVFVLGLLLEYLFAIILKDTVLWLPPSGRLTSGLTLPPLDQAWGLTNLSGAAVATIGFFSKMYIFNSLVTGHWEILADVLKHLILPAAAVGTIPMAIIARMTRSSMLDVLGLDYVRTARAKGLRVRQVIMRHALRNALLPVVTVIGLSLGGLLSGAVLTETVFNLAGVGRTLYESITARDYTVVQAVTLVVAVFYVGVNLLVDLLYAFLDPRIRLS